MKANKMEDVNVKTMKTSSGKVRKRRTTQTKRRKLRGTVVKMLAMMESKPESTDPVMEFLVTGRTGRRNAMADILGPNASVTSGDLPEKLQSLSTADADAGPSSSGQGTKHEEEEDEDERLDHFPSSQENNNEAKSKEKDVKAEQNHKSNKEVSSQSPQNGINPRKSKRKS